MKNNKEILRNIYEIGRTDSRISEREGKYYDTFDEWYLSEHPQPTEPIKEDTTNTVTGGEVWEAKNNILDYAIINKIGSGYTVIATVTTDNGLISKDEMKDNANLIAAAPELLRMLKVWKSAIDIIVSSPEAMDKERLKVYQSLQQSETYKQTEAAIKAALQNK